MNIFKIVLYIFLINCIQNFEVKHKEKSAHTLSHTGSQISGYWACVIIPLLSMVLYSAHREDKLEMPPWTSISFDFMITIFSLATQEKYNIQMVMSNETEFIFVSTTDYIDYIIASVNCPFAFYK